MERSWPRGDRADRVATGRTILVFHRHRAPEAFQAMSSKLGVRRSRLAAAEDFTSGAPGEGSDGLVFNQLGIAVLNRPPEDAAALPGIAGSAITIARPEYVLRIPRYRVAPAYLESEANRPALASSDGRQSWALEVTKVAHSRTTGKGIRVAVLDSGVSKHPDLPPFPVGSTMSFVPGDTRPDDMIGHGTHCAGVLAGAVRPSQGPRYGVAPGATLFVGRVADPDGKAPEQVIVAGIDWALRSGCRVISLSLGVPTGIAAGPDPVYEKIAAVAAESRCLVVAAAGNESAASIDQPAASTSIMGVTASTRAGVIAMWANRGQSDGRAAINLSAPGVGIRSAWNDGGYRLLDGTSCATPIVAGIAALFCQHHPEMRSDQIWDAMCRTALPLANPLTRMPLPPTTAGAGLVQAPGSS